MLNIKPEYKAIEPGRKGKFIVSPLNQGDGNTLGNAMRRLLMSDMEGVAISAVKIEGVKHEMSTIKGVKEDVVEIVLNLKTVAVKANGEVGDEIIGELKGKGIGVLKAGDIQVDAALEIVNKDAVICTLDKDANVEMQIYFSKGSGYVSAKENRRKYNIAELIAIDSMYSPVTFASYTVEDTRQAGSINKEKLTLNVETKATATPEEVVVIAAKKLKDLASIFTKEENAAEVGEDLPKVASNIKLNDQLEVLGLEVRATNSLRQAGYNTVGDIVALTEQQLRGTRKIGTKTADNMIIRLNELGYTLKGGCVIPEKPKDDGGDE